MKIQDKRAIKATAFTLVLLWIIPFCYFTSQLRLPAAVYISTLLGLLLTAVLGQVMLSYWLEKKYELGIHHQQSIILVSSIVFLELNDIQYTFSSIEDHPRNTFNLRWKADDPNFEQLRVIFCSLCLNNYEGIIPTVKMKGILKKDWEQYVYKEASAKFKKALWQGQKEVVQKNFIENQKLIKKYSKIIQFNKDSMKIIETLRKQINH